MDSDSYRQIMRHQAGAVAIIAVGRAGERTGLTATAVCSLSDSPPMLLVCVNRTASAHDPIANTGAFSVNLLASTQQDVAGCFSGRTGLKGEARFHDPDWTTLATGAPILSSALASLDCKLVDRHEFATHTVFIGAIADGRVNTEAAPLLYFRGDFWDLGRS